MTEKALIEKYKALVKDKEIGELQKLGRKRQLKNLQNPPKGYKFSIAKAQRVVDFLQLLPHVKGQLAGQLFKLEEWQKFDIVYPLFGWVTDDENEYRRYKIAYNEMARKTGKSFLMSGIGIYMTWFDGEPGAETYIAATKKDQSRLVWDVAHDMVSHTTLKKRVKTAYTTMTFDGSKMVPLGADSKTLDGLSCHCGIFDEVHAMKNSHLYDVIKSSTGARVNSLLLLITTAGFDKYSFCYEERTYAEKILKGQLENERYFAFIACLDKKDDPFDEGVWRKSNPNLNVSNSIEDFRAAAKEAKQKGGQALTEFLTKRLNVWMEASSVWVSDENFLISKDLDFEESDLFGEDCYIGLDLSKTSDLSAFSAVFPLANGEYKVISRAYVPEASFNDRKNGDNIYQSFVDEGTLTVTPGNIIDYNTIFEDIKKDMENFNVIELSYDRYMAFQIVTDLTNEGLDCIGFGQGFLSMSPPTKLLETLLLEKKLHHNNDALMRWQLSNVVIEYDAAANIKMSKASTKSNSGSDRGTASKIDSWVATAMALGRASLNVYYEDEAVGVYLL